MSWSVSLRAIVFAITVFGAAFHTASPAAAMLAPQRMDDPGTQFPEFIGDGKHLPVNCYATPRDLLAHAQQLQAVRQAVLEFERRGYTAVPEADVAINGCPDRRSCVGLAYRRPVAWHDSSLVLQPVILVVTRIHPWSGEPLTTVTAGIAAYDPLRGTAVSGDALGLEPSFDVRAGSGGGRGVLPEQTSLEGKSCFRAVLDCSPLHQCMRNTPGESCPPLSYPWTPCNPWIAGLIACLASPATRCLERCSL